MNIEQLRKHQSAAASLRICARKLRGELDRDGEIVEQLARRAQAESTQMQAMGTHISGKFQG